MMQAAQRQGRERRLRALTIDRDLLIPLFLNGSRQFWIDYRIPGLPADTEVYNVSFDPTNAGFVVVLWSSEFAVVPDMEMVPYFYNLFFNTVPNLIDAAENLLAHIDHKHINADDAPGERCEWCVLRENELRAALMVDERE